MASEINRTIAALGEVQSERERQREKWGGADHDDQHHDSTWLHLIMRQLGDASRAIERNDGRAYRRDLVQAAALAVAAIESYDRKSEGQDDGE